MGDKGGNTPRQHTFRAKLKNAVGRTETTVAILASSEAEALEQVRSLALSHTVELWDGGRLVASVPMQKPR